MISWLCEHCARRVETPDKVMMTICNSCQECLIIEKNPPKKEYIVEREVRE